VFLRSHVTKSGALQGMTVRKATAGDDVFLLRLYVSTRAEEVAQWGWAPAQQQNFLRMQFQAQRQSYRLQYPDAERLVIEAGGAIGAVTVSSAAGEIRLVDLAFLPNHRGKGLGTEILHALLGEAKAAGLPLRLSVLRTNRAANLYGRLGFTPCGGNELYMDMEWLPG
jgi:GNAT superfamily N-acetyltransferase